MNEKYVLATNPKPIAREIKYDFITHMDPMANSHVALMTVTKRFGEHIAYQALPVPADGHPERLDQAALKALFNKWRRPA